MMEDSSSWRPGNFGKDLAAEAAKEKPKPTETSEVDSSLTNGHSEEAEPIEPEPIEPEPEPVDPAVPSRTLTPDPVEEDDKSESTVVGGDASKQIDDVTFEGSPEEVKDQIRRRVGGANMTETDISKLLSVFDTPGVLSSHGGIAKFRTVSDMRDTINESDAAFNTAIDASRNRKIPGISEENRRLMQDILKKSAEDQDAMSNRVAALLAGTSLTTTAGTSVRRRDDIEEVGYETFGDVGTYKGRKDRFVPPVVRVTGPGTSPGPSRSTSTTRGPDPNHLDTTRPSIMRQSQSLSRLRKLTDKIKEDEKERKQRELERGEIRGLRRAKVPLMVYSCGGFTRCFRIARFYSTEGPPIGISYDRSTRAALNPELN